MMAKSPAWPRTLRLGSSTRFRFRQAEQPPWAGAAQPVKLADGSSAHRLLPAAVPSYGGVRNGAAGRDPVRLTDTKLTLLWVGLPLSRARPRHRARFARGRPQRKQAAPRLFRAAS